MLQESEAGERAGEQQSRRAGEQESRSIEEERRTGEDRRGEESSTNVMKVLRRLRDPLGEGFPEGIEAPGMGGVQRMGGMGGVRALSFLRQLLPLHADVV